LDGKELSLVCWLAGRWVVSKRSMLLPKVHPVSDDYLLFFQKKKNMSRATPQTVCAVLVSDDVAVCHFLF
jgi:hypothetical protein